MTNDHLCRSIRNWNFDISPRNLVFLLRNSGTKGKESFAASQFVEMNFVVLGYIHSFNSNRRALTHKNTFFFTLSLCFLYANTPRKKGKTKKHEARLRAKREKIIDLLTLLSSYCVRFSGQTREANMRTDRKCHTATKRTVIPRCSPTHAIVSIFCFALFAKR